MWSSCRWPSAAMAAASSESTSAIRWVESNMVWTPGIRKDQKEIFRMRTWAGKANPAETGFTLSRLRVGLAGLLAQPQTKFTQLLGVGQAGRAGKQIGCGLRLRKSDDFANGIDAGHERDQTVETEGNAGMGRCTKTQCFQQKTEFFLRLFGADA